jgi:cbb3-type cytochrome oxidase maturation protein
MTIIIMLILISLVIAVCFLVSFLLILKSGQYDDLYSPSVRMLFEDKPKEKNINTNKDGKDSNAVNVTKKV